MDQKNLLRAYTFGAVIAFVALVAATNENSTQTLSPRKNNPVSTTIQPEFHYGTTKLTKFQQ